MPEYIATQNLLGSTKINTSESQNNDNIHTINVSVSHKTSEHPFFNYGSIKGFTFNDLESPEFKLKLDSTYRFDQSDPSNLDHPLRFYRDDNKSIIFTDGISYSGTPGTEGSYTELKTTNILVPEIYYQCGNHSYMGNKLEVTDDFIDQLKIDPYSMKISKLSLKDNFDDFIFRKQSEDTFEIKLNQGYADISEINTIQFKDVNINIGRDIKGTFDQITGLETQSGQIFRLYDAAFDRHPDNDGLRYWIDVYSLKQNTKREVADSFLNSSEFIQRYGRDTSDEQFINIMYSNVLNRLGDMDGKQYWMHQLSTGQETRAEVILGFTESNEYKIIFSEMTGIF